MATESRHQTLALITVTVVGFAIGYFFARASQENEKRPEELAQRPPVRSTTKRGTTPSVGKGSARLPRSPDTGPPGWEWVEDPNSREFFQKINLTKDDWEQVQEMERRRARGEYILKNERPTTRKFLNHDFGEIVSQAAAGRAAEYDQLFAQMGVSPEAAEQLKTHLAKIHRASLEATVSLQQIVEARHDYDTRVRSVMSEENYKDYRQAEESKPALREYQMFLSFAQQQNTALDPAYEQTLIGLIQTTQAHTSKSYHRPYDGLPQPTAPATERVIPAEEQEIAQISARVGQLLDLTSQATLPDKYRELLQRYYAERIEQRRTFIDGLKAGHR